MLPNPVKKEYLTFTAENYGLFMKFSKKLPIENYRQMGENSPHQVTLPPGLSIHCFSRFDVIEKRVLSEGVQRLIRRR
jgi:hypothetical protein